MSPPSPAGSAAGVAVLDLDYAEDSQADTDANFVMTGAGSIVEVQGTAEKTPFSRGTAAGAARAGAQRHRQADRPAEDGGDVSTTEQAGRTRPRSRRIAKSPAGSSSRRTIPASCARCASCWRPTASRRVSAGELGLPRAGGDRRDLSRERAHQGGGGRARRPGCRPSPTIPASWSMRSAARPASIRRAGPGPTRIFRRAMDGIEHDAARARRASTPAQRRRAFRLGAVRRLARRPPGGIRGRVDGTLVWPPRGDKGFGYDPMFLPDGTRRTFGEMDSEEKHGLPPKGRGLVAPRARLPQAGGGVPWRTLTRAPKAQARAIRRLRALAVLPVEMPVLRLQQPCAPRRHRRAALRARLRGRDRGDRRARAGPHRVDDLLRRRHAVADAAVDRRRDPRRDRAALDGRARRRGVRSKPTRPASRRRAFAAIAPPASTGCRSACRRSTTPR